MKTVGQILKHYAFGDSEETIGDQDLKYAGNHIISKVKRSPLALKVVGSTLRNKRSIGEWNKILRQDPLKETMHLLLFSFQCLPLRLQRCFAYCSMFPKGYIFNFDLDILGQKPHLISLWIALGFIIYIENKNELTLEETGMEYIQELLSYSFFEQNSDCSFVIHDLLHDLAEKDSKKQCHRIDDCGSQQIPKTCIHLSLHITEKLVITDIFKLRNLRSLIILQNSVSTNIFKSEKSIFQKLDKLRALYVQPNQQMEVVIDHDIDNLKHLRYLHVRHDRELPVSLAKLYHLQFSIFITDQVNHGYLQANIVPQGFGNLINLRTIKFYDQPSLRYVEKLHIDGSRIRWLRNLPSCESLQKNLVELVFKWSSTPSSIYTYEEVLEVLKKEDGFPWLHTLTLKSCTSLKIVQFSSSCLRELVVEDCCELMQLPPIDTLRQLTLLRCPKLTPSIWRKGIRLLEYIETDDPLLVFELDQEHAFGFIRTLILRDCACAALPNLEKLSPLWRLCIYNCPDIESVPDLPYSLQSLNIRGCGRRVDVHESQFFPRDLTYIN